MKVINLNESQYRRLFEIVDYSSGKQNNISDFQSLDKVSITSKINGMNGTVEDSEPIGAILPKGRGRKDPADPLSNNGNLANRR
jgi:hypothetical protein